MLCDHELSSEEKWLQSKAVTPQLLLVACLPVGSNAIELVCLFYLCSLSSNKGIIRAYMPIV